MAEVGKLTPAEVEQLKQIQRLAGIAGKLADYSLSRLVEYMSAAAGRPVTPQEALQFLDEHVELLSFELLDEAIARDFKVRALVNTALRVAGAVIRRNNGWVAELKTKGDQLFLQMLLQYRRDLYELLKDKPNLVNFLMSYVLYKMGV